jgi:hypothetical protein
LQKVIIFSYFNLLVYTEIYRFSKRQIYNFFSKQQFFLKKKNLRKNLKKQRNIFLNQRNIFLKLRKKRATLFKESLSLVY